VDDALLVRCFESLGNLFRNGQRFIDGNRTLRDAFCERRSFDGLHDERLHTVRVLETVDMCDVRMIEGRKDLGFAPESGESIGVGRKRVGKNLQGIVPPERGVVRAPDLAL